MGFAWKTAGEEFEVLRRRLLEAAGSAVNEAHPAFLSLSDPIRWLEGGCDLEADIVPAIQRAVAAKRTGKILCWSYFDAAVQEARDRRLLPMETPRVNGNGHHHEPDWVTVRKKQKAVEDAFDWGS
jgi:hypothetical protein